MVIQLGWIEKRLICIDMDNQNGTTSYRWNPPSYTAEEAKRLQEANNRYLNEAARRSGCSPDWVRALGGTPDPDLV